MAIGEGGLSVEKRAFFIYVHVSPFLVSATNRKVTSASSRNKGLSLADISVISISMNGLQA